MPFQPSQSKVFAFAVLLAQFGCAEASTRPGELGSSGVPQVGEALFADTVGTPPEGYLPTPGGAYYHKSCIHEIPSGAQLTEHGEVVSAGKPTYSLPSCRYPVFRSRGGRLPAKATAPGTSGWIEWAQTRPDGVQGDAFYSISSDMIVPAPPPVGYSQQGKVFFAFPALEPEDRENVLQPVLTYGNQGNYGGAYWTATSYICGNSSYGCTHSPVLSVQPGDSLHTTVRVDLGSHTYCIRTAYCWAIETTNTRTGETTKLSVTFGGPLTWADGGVVETYGFSSCSDYPATDMRFVNISLQSWFYTGVAPAGGMPTASQQSPNWMLVLRGGVTPFCSFDVQTTPTSATLVYH